MGRVVPEFNPWDHSFSNYELTDTAGIRYNLGRGLVGSAHCPFVTFFSEARDRVHSGVSYSAEWVVIVTNRLAWGELKTADVVIGTGMVRTDLL